MENITPFAPAVVDITVIVPSYRRFDWLAKCLDALEMQTMDKLRYRVVVIDNSMQQDLSKKFLADCKYSMQLEYIITEKSGAAYARNIGIKQSNSNFIACIDDDALAEPDWLECILEFFARHPGAGVIGGKTLPLWEGEKPEWIQGKLLHQLAVLDWGDTEFSFYDNFWLVGANSAYRAEALRLGCGFNEKLGPAGSLRFLHEEYALNTAIVNLGYEMWYVPTMKVHHCMQAHRCTQEWFYESAVLDVTSMYVYQNCCNVTQNPQELARDMLQVISDNIILDNPTYEDVLDTCSVKIPSMTIKLCEKKFVREGEYKKNEKCNVVYIVTPCLNAAGTIDRTILSVISQSGNFSMRYHVQDGGSTDGTLERLKFWQVMLQDAKHSKHFTTCKNFVFSYSSEQDCGVYHAVQKAFDALCIPSDAIMTWINASDTLMPNSFMIASSVLNASEGKHWITGPLCTSDGKCAQVCSIPFDNELIAKGCCDTVHLYGIQQEGTFFTKELWDTVGGLDTSFKLAADWDLWRRFAAISPCIVSEVPLGTFFVHEGQLSQDNGGLSYLGEMDRSMPREERKKAVEDLMASGTMQANVAALRADGADVHERKVSLAFLSSTSPQYILYSSPSYEGSKAGASVPVALPPRLASFKLESLSPSAWYDKPLLHRVYLRSPHFVQSLLTKVKYGLIIRVVNLWKAYRHARIIQRSGLFFGSYYLAQNPDVAAAGVNPVKHYVLHGEKEGRKPNPYFAPAYYLRAHKDLQRARVAPLVHYILHGCNEGREVNDVFSLKEYVKKHEDLRTASVNPLLHYLQHGVVEGREV